MTTVVEFMERYQRRLHAVAAILLVANAYVWWVVLVQGPPAHASFYFLDVGQGDSGLVVFPGGVKMLVDGGPGNRVIRELDKILPPNDRYIDLLQLSHAQADHFEGLIDVLRRYRVGVFLWNGRPGTAQSFADLDRAVRESRVPVVSVGEGDSITIGLSRVDVLSPSVDLRQSKELNDGAVVLRVKTADASALYAGDIGMKVEKALWGKYRDKDLLKADILKVPHHGSKFSSSKDFIEAVDPAVAAIGVGKNSYGHPTADALSRLAEVTGSIFRTDQDGTIKITAYGGKLQILKTGK